MANSTSNRPKVTDSFSGLSGLEFSPYGIVLAFLSLLTALGCVFYSTSPKIILGESIFRVLLAASFCFCIVVLLLLLRDKEDNFAHGPKWHLPVAGITLLALVTALVVICRSQLAKDYIPENIWRSVEVRWYLILAIITPLTPLAFNAQLFFQFTTKATKQSKQTHSGEAVDLIDQRPGEDAEALGALVATLIALALTGLAVWAAKWGKTLELQNLYGVGLSGGVVGIFAVVVFLEPLSQVPLIRDAGKNLQWISKRSRFLASFYNFIDGILVNIGSRMVGMGHKRMWTRYSVLSSILLCLSFLGWFLPPPLGIFPSVLALVLALSVSRLWSWVEEDRALAALTNFNRQAPYKTEMQEDYRDETLLGFIFVFGLMPILMYQIHHGAGVSVEPELFDVPIDQQHSFTAWLGFFGIELAKAIPIVDWAEIYQIGNTNGGTVISMEGALSRHMVFLSRATVDLVLIAALIQAINISNRNRQQKRLYNAGLDPKNRYRPGLIDRLDEFVERLELKKAIRSVRRENSPKIDENTSGKEANKVVFDLSKLKEPDLIDFRRYNINRLQELHKSNSQNVRAFVEAIEFERPDFSLKTSIEILDLMAENGRNEADLYRIQTKLIEDETPLDEDKEEIHVTSLRSILFHTRTIAGLKLFKLRLISYWGKVAKSGSSSTASLSIEQLADIAGLSNPDSFQYTKTAAIVEIANIATMKCELELLNRADEMLRKLNFVSDQASVVNAIRGAIARVRRAEEDLTSSNQT